MTKDEYIYELGCVVPLDTQEEWDNSGIQIDLEDRELDRVLVALEITDDVIDEAASQDIHMIVTHHPLFFRPARNIDAGQKQGKMIADLIRNDISVYSLHTNFDRADGGNNDFMAGMLGLSDVGYIGNNDMTRMGYIDEIRFADLLDSIEGNYRSVGDPDRIISSVGICTGAGSEFLELAAVYDIDLFVTGDVKYHEARLAEDLGICLLDLGHYETEKCFPDAFISMMKENGFNEIEFVKSESLRSPFNE